jgi:phage shock protein C
MNSGRKFRLDRREGKLFGVCAGLAHYTGWDVTLIRVGVVLVTLLGAFPWTLVAYGAAALVAKPRSHFAGPEEMPAVRASTASVRESTREIDRRLAEVETFVSHSNSGLAREIENLR